MKRRQFLGQCTAALAASAMTLPARNTTRAASIHTRQITWHDVSAWGVEGKGWRETERYYDRLPAKAKGVVRDPVWDLSRHSAGMMVRFQTDARQIDVRYELLKENLAMPHMPATGVSGLDLYAQDATGQFRWAAVLQPTSQQIEQPLIKEMAPGRRTYMLYLPLYNGVNRLEIGVEQGASFDRIPPRIEPPMLFYGTSILHGACASRPGMAFPSILGRRLNRPVINLGFSGNGRMEPEVGALLVEQNPCVFVIDCLPNMTGEMILERAKPLVEQLQARRPRTPIILVEDRSYADGAFKPARANRNKENRQAFRAVFEQLIQKDGGGLHYVDGDSLLGSDGEGTTDGSHPNDLGMMRYADALEPILRKVLKGR